MRTDGLRSWGNHPPFPQSAWPMHWRGEAAVRLQAVRARGATTLAYGNGRSYGDSCLAASDEVLAMRGLDRFASADWSRGVLCADAGVTLGEILSVAIPQGWFLPVTPGTKYVTLGGAIANDVHGKNHHRRGTFGHCVRRFGLLRSDSGATTCSAQDTPALFAATIGGLGLTGVIEWAEIQLVPIRSSRLQTLGRRFGDLDEFFAFSDEHDERHEFSVSWVDCAAGGKALGRGVYVAGDFADDGPLEVESPRRLAVPVEPPVSLVTGLTVRAFNALHWRKAPRAWREERVGYDAFFYPLDALLAWNRIYGRQGFQQYQCVIPEREARAAIGELLREIARLRTGSFLAVLKRCGDASSPGLISFPMRGTTLALDFPQSAALDATVLPRLDAIVRASGGRLYPAKDAHMSGADFRQAYPRWREVEALRDPTLLSRFWKRVTS